MATTRGTIRQLAEARSTMATGLEQAIAALGAAYCAYRHATRVLEMRVNADLERHVHPAITLHLASAGLSEFLERRLVGTAAPLAEVVDRQHRLLGVPSNGGAE